ncbi:hypothetical protein WISP_76594 [Willisornis vidua]|uniref:Uncharacterized protein n=1 Tax=Willisornis vidua TaxID=1566151 RepID=A0ABQ9D8U8_9PASS|nr:hypothetical protein WISP_76594 [Willisornis vidua]
MNDNFLIQLIDEPIRRSALVVLMLTNKEEFIGDVKFEGSLDYNDHEIMEFRTLRGGSRAKCKITAPNFRRDFKDSKVLCKYVSSKKKTRENLEPGDPVTEDMEKILNVSFIFSLARLVFRNPSSKDQAERLEHPWWKRIRSGNKLNISKSMEPDEMYP